MELAEVKSWGGRKIQANIAHYSSNRRVKGDQERPSGGWKANPQSSSSSRGIPKRGVEGNTNREQLRAAGWSVEEGMGRGVRVAPWVIKEQKRSLSNSLVCFSKSKSDGLKEVESWLESRWGKALQNLQMLDDQVIWMQFAPPGEVDEVLLIAASGLRRLSIPLLIAGEMDRGTGFPTNFFLGRD